MDYCRTEVRQPYISSIWTGSKFHTQLSVRAGLDLATLGFHDFLLIVRTRYWASSYVGRETCLRKQFAEYQTTI